LGYKHRISTNFNVIEKWATSDKTSIFAAVNNQIDPGVNNFNTRERHDLIMDIVQSAFDMFKESIKDLKNFIIAANAFNIEKHKIAPVYLDIKNRNRSKTSLLTNSARQKTISNDLKTSTFLIDSLNKVSYCYTDYLLLISIDRYELHYIHSHFNPAELTASTAYKDLKKKVYSFGKPGFKDDYEQEQEVAYLNIQDIVG
jgi:hypothetical protein